MATPPTKADLAGELATRLREVETALKQLQTLTEFRLNHMEQAVAEQERAITALKQQHAAQEERLKALEKLADHPATLAAHDQRLKALEKGNDRLWQFAPLVISAVAVIVAVVGLFVKK